MHSQQVSGLRLVFAYRRTVFYAYLKFVWQITAGGGDTSHSEDWEKSGELHVCRLSFLMVRWWEGEEKVVAAGRRVQVLGCPCEANDVELYFEGRFVSAGTN